MKPTSFYISLSVLVHLVVIDFIFTLLTSGSPAGLIAIGAYNIVWVLAAMRIGNEDFNESSN